MLANLMLWTIHLNNNQTSAFCQFNGVTLKLAKSTWLLVKGYLSKIG